MKTIKEALEQLLAGKPENPEAGICHYLTELGFNGYSWVRENAVGWPEHSGRPDTPIPYGYTADASMWQGEKLASRQSLLRYLITKCEE